MKMITNNQRRMSIIVFGFYLFLLTWLVLFKLSADIGKIWHVNMRSVNLVPFKASVIVNDKLQLSEIIYNILVFVPLGVYVQIFKPDWGIKKILPGLILSITYETIQYVFAIGASDITDVMGNTLGSGLGIGLCVVLRRFFFDKHVVIINGIGIVVEVTAFLLITLLTMANM